ncbi:uncharacterized protein LOC110698048 [Chenopodium quinoa]|uniref:uncharacterized protein LOC110698048 n=1 Tax=Chenopodium quinoa TaxID=63459 RepID=UPI000B77E809|nr:uncharacterized protein LOC110698048 [Chenopodium quinoa]XP_021731145.1 uncharacterized protein LOC110698048 [Chenopodium quinoa]
MRKDCFVSLHKRGKPLVLNTNCNDRGWAQYFVFVKKTSLGTDGTWLTEGRLDKDLNLDFLEPTERSSSKIKRIFEAGHAKRTFERTRHTLGESSGQTHKELLSTSQRVGDSEETMSDGFAAQGGHRGRNTSQAEKDARMRRKRGLVPQEALPSLAVDRTEQLRTMSP